MLLAKGALGLNSYSANDYFTRSCPSMETKTAFDSSFTNISGAFLCNNNLKIINKRIKCTLLEKYYFKRLSNTFKIFVFQVENQFGTTVYDNYSLRLFLLFK